jgi:hypothetical protein
MYPKLYPVFKYFFLNPNFKILLDTRISGISHRIPYPTVSDMGTADSAHPAVSDMGTTASTHRIGDSLIALTSYNLPL